jgi:hypothetical protein
MGQKGDWLSVPLICHMTLRILPYLGSWRNLRDIVKMKISNYLWDATPMRTTLPGVAPTVMVEGVVSAGWELTINAFQPGYVL